MLGNWLGLFFQCLFEDTAITWKYLKSHICNTSYTEINTLFVAHSYKESGNFKVRPAFSILKEKGNG